MVWLKDRFNKCCNWVGSKQDACAGFIASKCSCGNYRLVFNAPVTLWFMSACFLVFAVSDRSELVKNLFRSPVWYEVKNMGVYLATPFRFVLHIFGHGDWNHFLGNMTSLLLVLPLLEEKYKARWLVLITLVNALAASWHDLCVIFKSGIQSLLLYNCRGMFRRSCWTLASHQNEFFHSVNSQQQLHLFLHCNLRGTGDAG
ncbi:unnamed protein product [Durusdinium trenchii]|uniref:Peptidase S54 rhomboid domain-containing protein n=1 Tax=Durusdinium trenchii TaxID=1381693 RepID=A0ABP0J2F9_9DINO